MNCAAVVFCPEHCRRYEKNTGVLHYVQDDESEDDASVEMTLVCGGVGDDLREGVGIERSSADERAVDVFKAAERSGVIGFDGAAVEDACGAGDV
jgi:hypothetical protein